MSLARVYSRANLGVEAPLVTVEVHLGGGLPRTTIVGLPETSVREARERVKAALLNAGFEFPASLITISLAPAELRKHGSRFDLPIALGILAASGQVSDKRFGQFEFIGELSLSGSLNPVPSVLPVALQSRMAGRGLVLPAANGAEAAVVEPGGSLCAHSLMEIVEWLHGRGQLEKAQRVEIAPTPGGPDLSDVRGQPQARRALEIAAAGAHNLLLRGPPGTGKTMLASRLPGILPPLAERQAIETAAIASITPQGLDPACWKHPAFRAPHHSASHVALVGGGPGAMPGEISLAHNGVLFLDELPEFNRNVLEVLREPMESGHIVISRAAARARYPARFQLVAAMNPCPCGFHGDRQKSCLCSGAQISRYRGKVSGPLLDRIDLFVEVTRPREVVIPGNIKAGEASSAVRERVIAAREIQAARQAHCNARLDPSGMKAHCRLGRREKALLTRASSQLGLSPRGCQRVLKVARTIADLDAAAPIEKDHLAEAIGFRQTIP